MIDDAIKFRAVPVNRAIIKSQTDYKDCKLSKCAQLVVILNEQMRILRTKN